MRIYFHLNSEYFATQTNFYIYSVKNLITIFNLGFVDKHCKMSEHVSIGILLYQIFNAFEQLVKLTLNRKYYLNTIL